MSKKSTKKALILSVISLLACVSMLVGSTFAWFTDSVTSAGNKIQAGTLKIDLELLDKQSGEWSSIKESKAALFNYDLWEPGYTDVKVLKIENEGTLALKWMAKFVSASNLTILADVIDVYVKSGADAIGYPADRNLDGYTKVGTVADFVNTIEETTNGYLLPKGTTGDAAYLAIALKMQESAGNEYQGLPLCEGGNGFDIQIFATQYTYEEDSFDELYDEGLGYPDEDGDMLMEKDGIQYLYRADGSHWLYYVTPGYDKDTVIVPEGVTTIGGSSFSSNSNVKTVVFSSTVRTVRTNAFKGNTSVEKVVLNEGLEDLTSVERAFNQALGLKEVVFPSTLKTIGKQAFALSAIEELTIPASVEFLGEGAFRQGSNLTTVTIEGNPQIGNFAFRSCPNLKNVYLLGEDVTFAGTSQAFSLADTGNANGITIYVMNETVAARVRAAQGSAYGYTIVVMAQVTNEAELKNALTEQAPIIMLADDFGVSETINFGYDVTINGNGNTISREDGFTGTVFSVASGKTLTTSDLVIDGGAVWAGRTTYGANTANSGVVATGNLIATAGNAKVVLNAGTILQNNDGANAISLATRGGGSLTLNGAWVINNRSAAGAIWGGDDITINEGSKINGNHATSIGGAIRMVNGNYGITLTMNGGEINYNTSAGTGGAIWGGNKAYYYFNGGEMAYNSAASAGGAIWTGNYEAYYISGDFAMHDNVGGELAGAIRFCNYSSLTMTGGSVYNNTVNGVSNAFYLNNNSATITGGSIADNFSYSGGLGLTIGDADITGVISYGLSTNHNTAYLAADFDTIQFTVNPSASNFSQFNFKPAADYVYTAGDEAKLVCLTEGYATYWDAATGTFRLQAI